MEGKTWVNTDGPPEKLKSTCWTGLCKKLAGSVSHQVALKSLCVASNPCKARVMRASTSSCCPGIPDVRAIFLASLARPWPVRDSGSRFGLSYRRIKAHCHLLGPGIGGKFASEDRGLNGGVNTDCAKTTVASIMPSRGVKIIVRRIPDSVLDWRISSHQPSCILN